MAFVQNDGAKIYWQETGKGEPIVLIMGLGCSSALWFRFAPKLAKHYRVIMLDNRGVGFTKVDASLVHRVSTMASDVGAVLTAAGLSSAHVLGISMGGMIAQEFALMQPTRVRSLTLIATHCGGVNVVPADSKVWGLLFTKGSYTPEVNLRHMQPYTYAKSTSAALIEEDHGVRLASYPQLRGYQAQLYGIMGWSSYSRLPSLSCPTLVMHGVEDQLIVPANGELLAQRIPSANLDIVSNASHWLPTDQRDHVVKAVREFVGKIQSTDR